MGKSHHRYPQLSRSNRKRGYKIYWKEFPIDSLIEKEKYYINLFKPELNGCKVKKYLPSLPQVEREIKRLLKALNTPTLLFPFVRSLVVGEYEGSDGARCIIILRNSNDFKITGYSIMKKNSKQVRNAWSTYISYCGKDKEYYQPYSMYVYSVYNYRFEFIELPNFIYYLEANTNAREQYVKTVEILRVKVKALRYLDIFTEVPIEEERFYIDQQRRKHLRNIDYLNWRRHLIKCLR
ncbi:hypothetical protein NIES4071_107160 (plasmid) [Calothrix sp. NIES-4071]|nr:hypothetical protein NIES4071_107160 [Calothrix sp. NIES-4071]BAZ64756.1 hypothetical protein NIES4105_104890 [Calothrix sp. NIES-4105]